MAVLLKILSLSIEYPNPAEPGKGLFVRARLQALAGVAQLKVVSPVAVLDYANPDRQWYGPSGIPHRRQDDGAEVLYPRWLYPPRGGFINGFCLAIRLLWPLSRLRRTFDFDLIDAHFAHPDGVAAALLGAVLGKPFVVTMRGSELRHQRFRWRRYWMGWALRRAGRVVTMSEELRELAVSLGADPARVKVIPNGIRGELFFPRDRDACRAEHGIGSGNQVILSAGDLCELKGHHRIIEALKGVRDAGMPAELIIAGGVGRSGRYGEKLRDDVAAAGLQEEVRFVGEVSQDQLAELMSAADVFCLASSREGWPNVVNEALACGTPVVGTDVGAMRQLIPSERLGLIVPAGDPAALRRGLQDALTRPWDRASIAAWGRSRSWTDVAGEVLGEMREVAREASRPKAIIVNADDLGINARINDVIFDLMARKRVTSATLMANGPALEDAARQLRHFPGCSFGIHLNLTQFEPVSRGAGAKLLTNGDGSFSRAIVNVRPTAAIFRAMYAELCAQVERLLALGVPISHIDSHHHVHTVPRVLPVFKAVQRRYRIPKIRISKNIYSEETPCPPHLLVEKRLYNWVLRNLVASQTTQGFTDLISFSAAARCYPIRHRTIEIMVHPGKLQLEEELALLESPWEETLPFPTRLISYNGLPQ